MNFTSWKKCVIVILLNSKIWKNDTVHESLHYFCNTEVVETEILNRTSLVIFYLNGRLPTKGWLVSFMHTKIVQNFTYIPSPVYLPKEIEIQRWIITE